MAKAKTATPRPPAASQEFESLTLALEGWFDRKLEDLPTAIRELVEREFLPIPWDGLSANQRHGAALQMDYHRDPATEQERQYWWDFFERMDELKAQIAQWKSAATPTASDISLKESRLKELHQEIARMELQQRQARDGYYPGGKNFEAGGSTPTTPDYIPYPKALKILIEKWQATPDELAAWIFLGPETGGLAAYRNANELNPPPRFYFAYYLCEDYLSLLMSCWFRRDDIARFEPADRYITGTELIERWGQHPGLRPEAFIRAKIAESRLLDLHPTFGGTQGTFDDEANYPPLTAGLFSVSHIERIEAEDDLDCVPVLSNSAVEPDQNAPHEKGGNPKGGRPNEVPLMGRKDIACYLGVSVSTVKNYMKDRTFPLFTQGGRRCAMPSGLDAWRTRKKNMHSTRTRIS